MKDSDVVHQVRQCMELLSIRSGPRAIDYGRQAAGWSDYIGDRYVTAQDVNRAMIRMDAAAFLALKVQVLANDPREGWAAMRDLASFVSYSLDSGEDKYGRACIEYWVVYWARRDGSSRDAATRFGGSKSSQNTYGGNIMTLLDRWFAIAKGVLEPILDPEYMRVA